MKFKLLLISFITPILVATTITFPVHAQTAEELQVQIQSLLQTLSALQAQLGALQGGTGSISSFTRNLSIGDRGEDVKQLQKILNNDTRTKITLSGPGSLGNETDYFGSLTKEAVIKFQNLHAQEILTPTNLATGTGFVGPSTRTKLNTLLKKPEQSTKNKPEKSFSSTENDTVVETTVSTTNDQQVLDALTKDALSQSTKLLAAFVSPSFGPSGTQVIFQGSGFRPTNNAVGIGGDYIVNKIPSLDGTQLLFNIPKDIPFGKYSLYVSNTNGTTTENVFFIVTDPSAPTPIISTSTPASGGYGTEVTIIGKNFSPTGNNVYTSYGIAEDISSPDGKTLKFKVLPATGIPELQVGADLNQGIEWPIWFYVVSSGGVSEKSNPGKFILEI